VAEEAKDLIFPSKADREREGDGSLQKGLGVCLCLVSAKRQPLALGSSQGDSDFVLFCF
jgi:hypothetical protein